MNGIRGRRVTALLLSVALTLGCAVPRIALSQLSARDGEFTYRARPHDTLIGLGRRLLLDPRRWRDLQRRNAIRHPRRIPLGTAIEIPYAWLRMSAETALVASVSGTVSRDGKPLVRGDIVPQRSRIETGPDGSVTLDLADGSVVTLQESSELRLDTMQQVSGEKSAHDLRLELEKGRIQTAVKPHGDVGRFEIETPVAIAAVRGTRFRTAFDPVSRGAIDETLEGTVTVSGARSSVAVPAGFGTRVEAGGAPLSPVHLLPAPDLSAIPARSSTPRIHLQWPPLAGAVRYRVQLAADANCHTILADAVSTDPHSSLPAPPDGPFWIRVRGIDRLGLEGLDATKAMVERRLPPPPAPLLPPAGARIIGSHVSFSWSGAAAGARYRWQLARDRRFSAPVMDREIDGASGVEINGLQPGRYFWRIAAIDAQGEAGQWSATQRYTQRPSPPVLRAPEIERHAVMLRWTETPAARYHVQISRDQRFTRPLVDREVDAPRLSVPRPRAGTYYVRVQIIDSDGTRDPYGAPRRFEVPVARWVRIVLPIAAVVLALIR